MDTTDSELNRVLGGGIVPDPNIRAVNGMEKLLLQISLKFPTRLYVSGEELKKQIK
jgi:DNA repair protein RadA/Sms